MQSKRIAIQCGLARFCNSEEKSIIRNLRQLRLEFVRNLGKCTKSLTPDESIQLHSMKIIHRWVQNIYIERENQFYFNPDASTDSNYSCAYRIKGTEIAFSCEISLNIFMKANVRKYIRITISSSSPSSIGNLGRPDGIVVFHFSLTVFIRMTYRRDISSLIISEFSRQSIALSRIFLG